MLKLVTGMSTSRGFTLIEILIVLVIIGITFGFALLAFGDFGASRRILFAAEQLENTLHLAQQQAIIENSTLGLRIDNKGYQVLKFQNPSQWNSIPNKGLFKTHYFPANTVINLKINNKVVVGSAPHIVFYPSGDMTPFTLSFGTSKDDLITILSGTSDGYLNFIREKIK